LLTKNHRQEALSRAYIQAIAARAGMSCSFREFDYGIDVTVHDIRREGRRYAETGYSLDIQAKSTTAAAVTEAVIPYDLDAKNYDDLRDPDVGCPRLLVLLILPDEESQWTEQTEDQFLLRRAAYWISLKGREPSANNRTIRVVIPRTNLLTITALQTLMQRVKRRQAL
jgi:hypothetical protein